jgi:hypothetical protein
MDFHQDMLIHMYTALSCLFLSFSVLTFTCWTSQHNALVRVSKSRTGGSESICNCSDKTCRNEVEYSMGCQRRFESTA